MSEETYTLEGETIRMGGEAMGLADVVDVLNEAARIKRNLTLYQSLVERYAMLLDKTEQRFREAGDNLCAACFGKAQLWLLEAEKRYGRDCAPTSAHVRMFRRLMDENRELRRKRLRMRGGDG